MTEEDANDITETIIGCAFRVSNTLGCGFLEKVYENAMMIELKNEGLFAENQKSINVFYRNILVGEYFADILVEREIIIELKALKGIEEAHKAQLLNYLKATKKRLGLILNFGRPKVEIKRILNG